VLQRELNNPLKDAQGLAALFAIQNEQDRTQEGARQFDATMGNDNTRFSRQQDWTERVGKDELALKAFDANTQRNYYTSRAANESAQTRAAFQELGVRERLGMAGVDQQAAANEVSRNSNLIDLLTKAFKMNQDNAGTNLPPVLNPDDLSSILVTALDRQGVQSYQLPTQQNAATLEGLLQHYNETGERPSPETLHMLNLLDQAKREAVKPHNPSQLPETTFPKATNL
jgi:hypothetical protein